MGMSPPGYDPEADFAANGSVLCDDCGRRVRPRTLESLPEHGCAVVQQANRRLLALVVQRRVRRDILGNVWVLNDTDPAEQVDYPTLRRLEEAGLIATPRSGATAEPYYDITDRALTA